MDPKTADECLAEDTARLAARLPWSDGLREAQRTAILGIAVLGATWNDRTDIETGNVRPETSDDTEEWDDPRALPPGEDSNASLRSIREAVERYAAEEVIAPLQKRIRNQRNEIDRLNKFIEGMRKAGGYLGANMRMLDEKGLVPGGRTE